ncbi:MAG: glycosyltransferase [Candidatus Kerfeldbacteria bacterium CG15_BIG_FIL_POST_REV_8_21_14_020_45_12]|uniref:Glycosyltransferase n=1 Tax=Candidatus Kerfeldbacteria bacterium CG15_BIG_FIL_POST_REV_8_21_14_020_45_12 TaxID=2014247 RepID=A0A2M7H3D1_9BACT|nr:MAG: glycosyltransferase [Candidatus Kerfeldbacteria bacterium CG15_BIG_FIL_POST_REV_8_21_14_020_45_12]PJA93746.1 MAG: glycosyltransferase [Candidatus Kerfeldbacteria bacterium CG_4_9_14_3_um_filter_45_8]
MKYSVVIPVFNEEENVLELHPAVTEAMDKIGDPYEIIFVDDGSSDRTVENLQGLSPVTIIRLRKNFGQTAAMDAGIKQAKGEFIITLDGDGQNPPSEIPKLLKVMETGNYDVVSGWRRHRHDTFMKKAVSRGANLLRKVFVKDNIHDSGCSLKVYRRECFDNVDLFGEMHRFIPAVLSWSGYTVGEAEVEHQPRRHGVSKYGWKRIIKGLIDMISVFFWRKYASRPLHLFGAAGLLLIGGGGLLGVALAVRKFIFDVPLSESNLPLLMVLLFVLGVQFFVSGLLGDIVIRNYYSGGRKPYAVREVIIKTKTD